MPLLRFGKLDPEKRRRLLAAAAREFADHGFDGAALHRITDSVGISKAALYYYFHDKSDLYAAAIDEAWKAIQPPSALDLSTLDAHSFWPELLRYYLAMLEQAAREPWLAAAGKLFYRVAPESGASVLVAEQLGAVRRVLERLVRRGQELGVVRRDLPEAFIVALVAGVAEAGDRFMVDAWESLGEAEVQDLALRLFDVMRSIAAPASEPPA